jgi:GT2 family glycosyltransferase
MVLHEPMAVVTIAYNSSDNIVNCLTRLKALRPQVFVVVVDNGSHDGTANLIDRHKLADRLIRNRCNLGYGAAVNQAFRAIDASEVDYSTVTLLDPDCFVDPLDLCRLQTLVLGNPRVGAVSPLLLRPDGEARVTSHTFRTVLSELRRIVFAKATESSLDSSSPGLRYAGWVVGSCLVIRNVAAMSIRPIAERFFVYVEDIDICYRLGAAGWDVAVATDISAVHLGGRSLATSPLEGFAPVLKLVNELSFYESIYGRRLCVSIATLRLLRQLREGSFRSRKTAILLLAACGLSARLIGRMYLRSASPSVKRLIPERWLADEATA